MSKLRAWMYICDGDVDHPVLTHAKMDWADKYPHWSEVALVPDPVLVGLTEDERTDVRSRVQEYIGIDNIKYGLTLQIATEQAIMEKNK
jgi:hypothetical protein